MGNFLTKYEVSQKKARKKPMFMIQTQQYSLKTESQSIEAEPYDFNERKCPLLSETELHKFRFI